MIFPTEYSVSGKALAAGPTSTTNTDQITARRVSEGAAGFRRPSSTHPLTITAQTLRVLQPHLNTSMIVELHFGDGLNPEYRSTIPTA